MNVTDYQVIFVGFKTEILKKGDNNVPLNGYIIELTGDIGEKIYHMLRRKKDEWDKKMGLV
jgi:hypothetical protein